MSVEKQIIVEERLGKPSTVTPTLFVGLGGCGSALVLRVAKHLRQRADYKEIHQDLARFVLIDTNINDLEKHRENVDDSILISNFEKARYTELASGQSFLEPDDYFTQWVPSNYRFRAGDTAGAGQIRIEARLGCYYQMKHGDMLARLRKQLNALKSHDQGYRRLDTTEIRIILCYSIAGGTGSGSHLPLAYTLRDLAKELGKPSLIGMAVLPSVFDEKVGANRDGTHANGYGALKETEYLMKLGAPDSSFYPIEGRSFHYNPSNTDARTVRDKPFEFLYLIDRPERFTSDDVVAAAGDALYLQLFSPIFGEQMGDYDNYTQHQRFLVPHDFDNKGIEGFTSFYGTCGASVMHVPVSDLTSYCASKATLALLKQSFLRDLPPGRTYRHLFGSEHYFKVRDDQSRDDNEIREVDFGRLTPERRRRLEDNIFERRISLLAHAELDNEEGLTFFTEIYRHGHRLGILPQRNGYNPDPKDELSKVDKVNRKALLTQYNKRGKHPFSLGEYLMGLLVADNANTIPRLLKEAEEAVERRSFEMTIDAPTTDPFLGEGTAKAMALFESAQSNVPEAEKAGRRVLARKFEPLINLEFLEEGGVNLLSKRYALLRVLKALNKVERGGEAYFETKQPDDRDIKESELEDEQRRLRNHVADDAKLKLHTHFNEHLQIFIKNVNDYLDAQYEMQKSFPDFAREEEERLRRRRESGGRKSDRYILHVEALRIETGRRMWDFFFWDRYGETLDLSNKSNQQIIARYATDKGRHRKIKELFADLKKNMEDQIRDDLEGVPTAADIDDREGFRLDEAIELEVEYRAIYNSNRDGVEKGKEASIRTFIAEHRAKYKNPSAFLDDEKESGLYTDYIRDKVMRAFNEKASLLNYYDDSRDRHGGVRPNHVTLGCISPRLASSRLGKVMRSTARGMKWLTKDWSNPREIIFYRSTLNVPLYVFPRMDEMKEHYYSFKSLSRRSKVLHIDKNWEDTLLDLDPQDAIDDYRRRMLRREIVNFAALWVTEDEQTLTNGTKARTIVFRNESAYWLRNPSPEVTRDAEGKESVKRNDQGHALYERVFLGNTFSESIQRLPELMSEQPIRYFPYRRLLHGIAQGLSPATLMKLTHLPFEWRRSRDDLRTSYGSKPTPEQEHLLRDFTETYNGLHDALLDMLGRLRDRQQERETLRDGLDTNDFGLSEHDISHNLGGSIRVLGDFDRDWEAMTNPSTGQLPTGFIGLFSPINENELRQHINRQRGAMAVDVQSPIADDHNPIEKGAEDTDSGSS